jgi:Homeodomain-like domain-containing protein
MAGNAALRGPLDRVHRPRDRLRRLDRRLLGQEARPHVRPRTEARGPRRDRPRRARGPDHVRPLIRAIAEQLGVSYTTVRHWLKRYELTTPRARRLASTRDARATGLADGLVDCPVHGPTRHVRRKDGGLRCLACRSAAVSERRRRLKALLVAEAGGCCVICGYADNIGALQFHHVDPAAKSFALGQTGVTRSLDAARAEAAKCVLLCARCHAEVEQGFKRLPLPPMTGREAAA